MSENFLDLKQLVPVDWSSEGHLHIGWLILEVALDVVGIASIAIVVLIVSSSCVAGAFAGIIIIIIIIFVSILVIWVIILTLVIWVPNVSFIDLEVIITEADINLVDLVHPSHINGLLCKDVGLKIRGFLKGCL